MTENTKKFIEKISQDVKLAEKLRNATAEQVMALAKELGCDLTEDDFAQPEGEVSEDELGAVAGGKICGCFTAGGGGKSTSDDVCACFMSGSGLGEYDSGEKFLRCGCVITGGGD